jgi:selT/selW/selH-like putative selenoprotein
MYPTAAWMATEFFAVCGKDVALQLTPAGGGAFEIYLNGEKIWDRKEVEGRPYPSLATFRQLRQAVVDAVNAAPVAAPAD